MVPPPPFLSPFDQVFSKVAFEILFGWMVSTKNLWPVWPNTVRKKLIMCEKKYDNCRVPHLRYRDWTLEAQLMAITPSPLRSSLAKFPTSPPHQRHLSLAHPYQYNHLSPPYSALIGLPSVAIPIFVLCRDRPRFTSSIRWDDSWCSRALDGWGLLSHRHNMPIESSPVHCS